MCHPRFLHALYRDSIAITFRLRCRTTIHLVHTIRTQYLNYLASLLDCTQHYAPHHRVLHHATQQMTGSNPENTKPQLSVITTPRGTRRVRVHVHRRRARSRRLLHVTLFTTAIFSIIGLLTDLFHPRSFSNEDLRVLTSLEAMTHPSCSNTRPARTQVYTSHGALVSTRLLCWTPVEQISLVRHSGAPRDALLPAAWASIRWLRVSGDANLSLESSTRFRPVRVRLADGTVLEYATGFVPALMLQRGAMESLAAFSPFPLLSACIDVVGEWSRYNFAVVTPALRRVTANVWRTVGSVVDAPFRTGRRLAQTVRARRDAVDVQR